MASKALIFMANGGMVLRVLVWVPSSLPKSSCKLSFYLFDDDTFKQIIKYVSTVQYVFPTFNKSYINNVRRLAIPNAREAFIILTQPVTEPNKVRISSANSRFWKSECFAVALQRNERQR